MNQQLLKLLQPVLGDSTDLNILKRFVENQNKLKNALVQMWKKRC